MICWALGIRGSHFHAPRALLRDWLPSMLHALRKHMRRLRLMTTEKCSYRSSISDEPSNLNPRTSLAFRSTDGRSIANRSPRNTGSLRPGASGVLKLSELEEDATYQEPFQQLDG